MKNNIEDVDKKTANTIGIVKKTNLNKKNTEIENKVPSIVGLVNTATLNANVRHIVIKMLDINNLARKDVLSTKATEIENRDLTGLTKI